MTDRQTTPERFTAAVALAVSLPHPTDIYRAILSGARSVDDGLKGTAYDGDRVSSASASSHPERQLERRHPGQFPRPTDEQPDWEAVRGTWGTSADRSKDDLLHLRRALDRVLESIDALNAECCDAGTVDTWDEATSGAEVLIGRRCSNPLHPADPNPTLHIKCTRGNHLQAAMDVGRNVEHWALRFAHAVDTVRAIRDSWMAHEPAQGLAEENFAWCRPHLTIGAQVKRETRMCCRTCYRWIEDLQLGGLGAAVELQLEKRYWPSEDMLRSNAEGRRAMVARDRRDWLVSLGLNPQTVDRLRSARRAS